MGRKQALAETVGRTEDQAHRKEQGAGGSTETNQSSQRDASTVCKLSQRISRPSTQLLLLTVREVPLYIILEVTNIACRVQSSEEKEGKLLSPQNPKILKTT